MRSLLPLVAIFYTHAVQGLDPSPLARNAAHGTHLWVGLLALPDGLQHVSDDPGHDMIKRIAHIDSLYWVENACNRRFLERTVCSSDARKTCCTSTSAKQNCNRHDGGRNSFRSCSNAHAVQGLDTPRVRVTLRNVRRLWVTVTRIFFGLFVTVTRIFSGLREVLPFCLFAVRPSVLIGCNTFRTIQVTGTTL